MIKKSVVIKAPKIRVGNSFNDYKSFKFFCVLFCGIIFGVMLSLNGGENWHHFFKVLVQNHLSARENATFLIKFCGTFLPFFIVLIIDYILGLCGVGIPFIYILVLSFGIYSGISATELYNSFSVKGIEFYGFIDLPCNAIVAATLIKCSCYSSDLSNYVFSILFNTKSERKSNVLKDYSVKYLFMTIPIVLGSLLNTMLFEIFGELFVITV